MSTFKCLKGLKRPFRYRDIVSEPCIRYAESSWHREILYDGQSLLDFLSVCGV